MTSQSQPSLSSTAAPSVVIGAQGIDADVKITQAAAGSRLGDDALFDVGSLEVRRRKTVSKYGYYVRGKFRREKQDLTEDEAHAISN
eukprot:2555399-Karenia_brevis.AAC.1